MNKKKKKLLFDITQLEPIDELDEEELSIHKDIQAGKGLLCNDEVVMMKYAKIFKEANHKRKALSIRMLEADYIGIKTKALELGMPYQSLINSVIHRYLTGDLK